MYEFMVYLKTACQDLYDGNVTVHNLKSICSNRDNFLKIIQEMENLHVGKDIVLQSANLRQMQVVSYEADLAVVQHFIYVCRNCRGRFLLHVEASITKKILCCCGCIPGLNYYLMAAHPLSLIHFYICTCTSKKINVVEIDD